MKRFSDLTKIKALKSTFTIVVHKQNRKLTFTVSQKQKYCIGLHHFSWAFLCAVGGNTVAQQISLTNKELMGVKQFA